MRDTYLDALSEFCIAAVSELFSTHFLDLWRTSEENFVSELLNFPVYIIRVDMGEDLGVIHLNHVAFIASIILTIGVIFYFVRLHYRTIRYNNILVAQLQQRTQKVIREQQELKKQHSIASKKSAELLSSLTYAKQIQSAFLQDEPCLQKYFPKSFALLESKELVCGDFYWATEKYDTTYLAVVDCTGHGVPGAFMSLIARSVLQEVIQSKGVLNPSNILEEMRSSVTASFSGGSAVSSNDGMDLSLCSYNRHNQILCYSGANQSLFVIRKDTTPLEDLRGNVYQPLITQNGTALYELKADRQPIGIHYGPIQPFTNHTARLQNGDRFFAFTDGFRDQFGGANNKKLKANRFRNLILSTQNLAMSEQRGALLNSFRNWKGSFDQNDDMCLVGVEL